MERYGIKGKVVGQWLQVEKEWIILHPMALTRSIEPVGDLRLTDGAFESLGASENPWDVRRLKEECEEWLDSCFYKFFYK
jgi:hypothetical protein